IMWSAIEGASIAVGEALVKDLTVAVNAIETLAGQIRQFVTDNQAMIVTVAKVAVGVAAAGTAILGLGLAASAAGMIATGLATGLSALGAVIAFLTSPIGLVVAALGGLAYV